MRTEQAITICVEAPIKQMRRLFGVLLPELERTLRELGFNAISKLTQTDAHYHDLEHSVLVSSVLQLILRGKHAQEGSVTPKVWASLNVAALYHDVGFVRGLLSRDDRQGVDSGQGAAVTLSADCNDGALLPYHVDRGLRYLEDYLLKYPALDRGLIMESIERTRFPVPAAAGYQACADHPGLLRAADLIGQLGDPRYLAKVPRLYQEFVACRSPMLRQYRRPSDMVLYYPEFFQSNIERYIQDGLRHLTITEEGKAIARQLYRNVDEARRYAQEDPGPAVASEPTA